MSEPRILVVGGSPSLTAALVAALAGAARVTVVAADEVVPAPEPRAPLEFGNQLLVAEVAELREPHAGYGPPRLGKKGKVRRW